MKGSQLIPLFLVGSFANSLCVAAEPSGRIVGRVTVEKSGEPVAGAKITAMTGMSDDHPGKRYASTSTLTNERGEYELRVPFGNITMWLPDPPAGFWQVGEQLESIAVTHKKPTAERSYKVRRGSVWRLIAKTTNDKPIADARVMISRASDVTHGKYLTDADGGCLVTVPADGGKLSLGFSDEAFGTMPRKPISIDVPAGFENSTATVSSKAVGKKTVELLDKEGRKASIDGGEVTLSAGTPTITLAAELTDASSFGEIAGRVVDGDGRPVEDAIVIARTWRMRSQDDICKTDAQGEFRLQRFLKSRSEDDKPAFELLVAKPGYAVTGSEQIEFTPDETGTHRLKSTLRLAKGQSLQLKILEKDGSPAEGAWVQPRGVGAARVAKSDEEGLCLLHDMPLGLTSLIVHYGSQYVNQTIVVSPSTEPEPPIRIRLTELDERRSSTVIKPKPLKPGERGPEWNVVGWSDGREHKLSDYRGRVVLIDFWGMWCGPCMQAIPAMQELHEKYAERVDFLGIHTANTEVSQVKKLLQLKKWDVLAAVDAGVDAAKSESAARYGVRGYPTFVVVGRDGRIGFNSSVPVPDEAKWMAEMKRDAEELKIPWPINKDASDQEVDGRLERLLVHRLSKELDKALAEPATD